MIIGQCRYLLSFGLALFILTALQAKSWKVSESNGIAALKHYIQQAASGDTIFIEGGVYRTGNLVIDKSIHLIGIGLPVFDGEDKFEILTLSGHQISVKGIHFKNSGYSSMNDYAAIKCIDASDVCIEQNEISFAYFAIHVSNSKRITIRQNKITGKPGSEQNTGNGIHLWKCSFAQIDNNVITGHRDGIYFEFVTDSKIECNLSKSNIRYGLHFMFSHRDRYEDNQFIANGAGVAVMYSREVHMHRNEFLNNWGSASYGILLKDITDSEISRNAFLRNTVGIYMEGSSRMTIQANQFSKNGWAMKVQASCNDNEIMGNNFQGNSFDMATNGTLVLNNFDRNYWDKYDGYDLSRDGIGDIPYRPVSMYSMIVEQNPYTLILLRSILIGFLDKAEKAIPGLTPELLIDKSPLMKPVIL